MESYSIFRDLAIIIIFAKVFGIIARKCKAPQVVGEIIAFCFPDTYEVGMSFLGEKILYELLNRIFSPRKDIPTS